MGIAGDKFVNYHKKGGKELDTFYKTRKKRAEELTNL